MATDNLTAARHHLEGNRNYKLGRWVTDEEGDVLRQLAERSGVKVAYESGTANGFSACWISKGMGSEGKVYTFDPSNRPKVWDDEKLGLTKFKNRVVFFKDTFEDGAPPILFLRQENALFFIDGGHSTTAVNTDYNIIQPSLREGDYIVFHDTHDELTTFWRRFQKKLVETNHTIEKFNTKRGMILVVIGSDEAPVAGGHD